MRDFRLAPGNQTQLHAREIVPDAPPEARAGVLTVAGVHKRFRPAPMRADAWWAHLADWSIPANERIDRDRIGLRPAAP